MRVSTILALAMCMIILLSFSPQSQALGILKGLKQKASGDSPLQKASGAAEKISGVSSKVTQAADKFSSITSKASKALSVAKAVG